MLRRLTPFALIILVLALAACGSSDDSATTASTEAAAAETTPPTDEVTVQETTPEPTGSDVGCKKVAKPEPKPDGEPKEDGKALDASKTYTVTLDTNCGTIKIRLDVKRAPKTASSFASLVEKGLYDGLTFHRIVPGFVIQGGDPTGTGTGGPGYKVEEPAPSDLAYTRGIVAMAKGGNEPSGTSGSQFFIVTGDDAGLPPDYALVGKVVGSEAAVDSIEAQPIGGDPAAPEAPNDPVVISKATLAAK